MNTAGLRKLGDQSARAGELLWPGVITLGDDPKGYDVEVGRKELREVRVKGGTTEEGELLVKLRKELHAEKPAVKWMYFEGRKWDVAEVTGEGEDKAVWCLECERKT